LANLSSVFYTGSTGSCFGVAHAQERTALLLESSLADAKRTGRPMVYLNSSRLSKEEEARKIAERDQIRAGLICVFKCVEPCWTFEVHRNRARKMLELQGKQGKCAYLYHYYIHPVFGFMHARVQTWFPFAVQVCLNGREWLARQLDRAGLSYQRRDNKFMDVEDFAKAQALLDRQLRESWPQRLGDILRQIHPAHPKLLGRLPVAYYWSVYQSEWASDVVFRARADVERLFPQWVRHAITTYRSTDVLRFLGREVPLSGQVRKGFQGEVVSELCRREEGVRVKHWVNGNSIKMYDCDRVVRIETTINNPEEFKVYRPREGDPQGEKDWRVLRKGVADLHRRAQVSQAANERYAAATAALQETMLQEQRCINQREHRQERTEIEGRIVRSQRIQGPHLSYACEGSGRTAVPERQGAGQDTCLCAARRCLGGDTR